jgi:hypothetical protein
MQRRSKEIPLESGKELVIPSEDGPMHYPTDAVLTCQLGTLDEKGQYSRVLAGAGCKAFLIVLKRS